MYTIVFCAWWLPGRVGDRCGNRAAMAIVCVCVALPSYALLVLGPTVLGLAMWAVAKVLSGKPGASFSGSPAFHALVNGVTLPGLAYGEMGIFWFLGGVMGVAILEVSSFYGIAWKTSGGIGIFRFLGSVMGVAILEVSSWCSP